APRLGSRWRQGAARCDRMTFSPQPAWIRWYEQVLRTYRPPEPAGLREGGCRGQESHPGVSCRYRYVRHGKEIDAICLEHEARNSILTKGITQVLTGVLAPEIVA